MVELEAQLTAREITDREYIDAITRIRKHYQRARYQAIRELACSNFMDGGNHSLRSKDHFPFGISPFSHAGEMVGSNLLLRVSRDPPQPLPYPLIFLWGAGTPSVHSRGPNFLQISQQNI